MLFIYVLIEIDFLDMHSYFLPANQNVHLTTLNQSKFMWCHNVYMLLPKHTYWPVREHVLS